MTFSSLEDIREKRNRTEDNDFNIENFLLGSFRLCFPKSFKLISEVYNNLISELNIKYYFNIRSNRNNKLIGDAIWNFFTLKIYCIIEKEGFTLNDYYLLKSDETYKGLTGIFQEYEKTPGNIATNAIKEICRGILTNNLKEYLLLIKMFSILLVSEKDKKNLMKELGIYKPYKPTGKPYYEERELIYGFIPAVKDKLLEENNGKHQRGKTDTKTAVKKAIKILENRKLITRYKHKSDKIYDGFRKYDPHKPYKDLIREKSKEFSKKTK